MTRQKNSQISDIEGFVGLFTKELPPYFKKGKRYFLGKGPGPKGDFEYTGTYLGTDSAYGFKPGIWLLDYLDDKTEKAVTINKKSEWMFLCGNDIKDKSVVNVTGKEGFFLVRNEEGEILGVALKEDTDLKNIFDRGDLLRRESRKIRSTQR